MGTFDMEEIACIFCGIYNDRVVIEENGYKGQKCIKCGLIYISPRPSETDTINYYKSEQAEQYADVQFGFEEINRKIDAHTLEKIFRFRTCGSILEIGTGSGHFLLEAQKRGYESYGIELNPLEARWIKDNYDIPCETVVLNEKSFDNKKFDIIYLRDVLSHLHDPISTFKNIYNALNEDGLLVFETGNIADLHEKYYKLFPRFLYPDHLFFFGENTCKTLLKRAGFKLLKVYNYSIFLQLILQKLLWRFKDPLKNNKKEEYRLINNSFYRKNYSLKMLLRKYYRYVSYLLVYRIGSIIPQKRMPQTMIIVAKKT
jgi:SAM-dependent methyltransferase